MIRSVVIKRVRAYLSDICKLINMAHKMYKFRETEELKIQSEVARSDPRP